MESEILRRFVEERRVEGSLLQLIEALAPKHHSILEKIIEELRPSGNTFRELLQLSREVAARDRRDLSEVLSLEMLQDAFGGDNAAQVSAKEKQKRLKAQLERLRYPERSKLHARVETLTKEIRRDFGVEPVLPEEFEGDKITFSLSASSPAQLGTVAEKLRDLAKDPKLAELYRLLLGGLEE